MVTFAIVEDLNEVEELNLGLDPGGEGATVDKPELYPYAEPHGSHTGLRV